MREAVAIAVPGSATPSVVGLALTATGTALWSRTHDNAVAGRWEQATSVAASANGNAFVGGTARMLDTGAEDSGVLMKFAPDGTLAWRVDAGLGMSSLLKVLVDVGDTVRLASL